MGVALILLSIAAGISLIVWAYRKPLANVPPSKKITIRTGEWHTDKQVVIIEPSEPSGSKELVRVHAGGAMTVHEPHYDWARLIRITITNGSQTHLMAELDINVDEQRMIEQVARADERCQFLNAHEVK